MGGRHAEAREAGRERERADGAEDVFLVGVFFLVGIDVHGIAPRGLGGGGRRGVGYGRGGVLAGRRFGFHR